MKRDQKLFHQIPLHDNFGQALVKALKGKRHRPDAQEYCQDMDEQFAALRERLRTGGGPIGEFREFTIWDPKKRIITAPCFSDRVLHHAIMNICEPTFESWLISQSFACRKGLGLRAAINEARKMEWLSEVVFATRRAALLRDHSTQQTTQ